MLLSRLKRAQVAFAITDPVMKSLFKGHCPDCGGLKFFMGPQGGVCQNIECSNPECGSRFNCGPFEDGWLNNPRIADRIGEPQPKRVTVIT